MEDKDKARDFTDRVNALYEGFSPMEIRQCVINMCETQFLDMNMRRVLEMHSDVNLLNVYALEDESLYAADIRWDHEHPKHSDEEVEEARGS